MIAWPTRASRTASLAVAMGLGLAGCAARGGGSDGDADDGSDEGSTVSSVDADGVGDGDDQADDTDDAGTSSTTSTDDAEDDAADDCGGFLGCDDTPNQCSLASGPGHALSFCDPWAQDCDGDQRCTPVRACDLDFDATVCVDHGGDPAGSACEPVAGGFLGEDSCDAASFCMGHEATGTGLCVELCKPPSSSPGCDGVGTRCVEYRTSTLPICVPACDPLALEPCASAGAGTVCTVVGTDTAGAQTGSASCVPRAEVPDSSPGDPCYGPLSCGDGQACVYTGWATQLCGASACCEELCELGGTIPCDSGYACVDLHDAEHPELGYCSPA